MPEMLKSFAANKGTFDVGFEASGSAEALTAAIDAVRPGSTIVQVGLSGSALPIPINMIVSKESLAARLVPNSMKNLQRR